MKRSMVGGRLLTGAIHRRCLVLLPSLSLAMVLPGIAMVLLGIAMVLPGILPRQPGIPRCSMGSSTPARCHPDVTKSVNK